MGWQDIPVLIRKSYQSKGGSVKKPKGFAIMDKNRHIEVSSLGGKNKRDNISNKGAEQTQESVSSANTRLEDVLNILNEDTNE